MNRQVKLLLCTLGIYIGLSIAYNVITKKTSDEKHLIQLIQCAKSIVAYPDRLVIKWSGYSCKQTNLNDFKQRLTKKMAVNQIKWNDSKKDKTNMVEATIKNIHLLVHVTTTGYLDKPHVMVCMETINATDLGSFIHMHSIMRAILQHSGINAKWNLAVQGHSGFNQFPKQAVLQIEENALLPNHTVKVDSYVDETTISSAYTSPRLPLCIKSGGQPVHMQLAAHYDEQISTSRLTVGFPLITIEY